MDAFALDTAAALVPRASAAGVTAYKLLNYPILYASNWFQMVAGSCKGARARGSAIVESQACPTGGQRLSLHAHSARSHSVSLQKNASSGFPCTRRLWLAIGGGAQRAAPPRPRGTVWAPPTDQRSLDNHGRSSPPHAAPRSHARKYYAPDSRYPAEPTSPCLGAGSSRAESAPAPASAPCLSAGRTHRRHKSTHAASRHR